MARARSGSAICAPNTWEDGAAKSYRFTSQNHLNQHLVDAVDGRAERSTGGVAVTLTKPKHRKLDLDAAIVFPTEHVRRHHRGRARGPDDP